MKNKKIKITKDLTEKLLKLLGVEAKTEVLEDKENEAIKIQIETSDPGILIGFHGETLSSLQLILGIIVSSKMGEWTRIILNVGDYREKREEILRKMALVAAQRVKFSGEEVVLPPLPASERRIVHLVLAENKDVVTQSEGEGRNRRVVVKLRQQT